MIKFAKTYIKTCAKKHPILYYILLILSHFYRFGPDYSLKIEIFRNIRARNGGFFIQVGANDGVVGDPIYDFVSKNENWSGLFIEPIDYIFERLKTNYGNAERFIFENVAISERNEAKNFYYVSRHASNVISDLPYWYEQIGSFNRQHLVRP